MRVILRLFAALFLIIVLYIALVLIHGSYSDYQPVEVTPLEGTQEAKEKVIQDSVISLVTWNIGFGGLGAESNFFYDNGDQLFSNGKMIRSPKELVDKNVNGVKQFVEQTKADFFLFQEVDNNSCRSYHTQEFTEVGEKIKDYSAHFAVNYNVPRVPLPILEPWRVYGETYSGLATYARYQPTESTRFQLPGDHPWPLRVFQLDRCLLLQRFPLANGKELVIGNVHNSAYDKGGLLKKQQMDYLKEKVLTEYEKGNYVILGGDWNQCPPNFRFDAFMPGDASGYSQINIANDFLPEDWQWVYDPTMPTNRKAADIYKPGETFITLIDFFAISPNLKALKVKGLNQNFAFSDHQPVYMEVEME